MSKKKSSGQWDHYKKWTTSEGYTFMALNETDAMDYLGKMPNHMGDPTKLQEVTNEKSNGK
tara:strand:+ start:408 stop:590 length:183 start_codon:yes stop_codon:yes gene_type:complete